MPNTCFNQHLDAKEAVQPGGPFMIQMLFNNISRNSPSNAKRWVGMDSEPSFSSAIFDLRYISL